MPSPLSILQQQLTKSAIGAADSDFVAAVCGDMSGVDIKPRLVHDREVLVSRVKYGGCQSGNNRKC